MSLFVVVTVLRTKSQFVFHPVLLIKKVGGQNQSRIPFAYNPGHAKVQGILIDTKKSVIQKRVTFRADAVEKARRVNLICGHQWQPP